jgi:hypothetical protein
MDRLFSNKSVVGTVTIYKTGEIWLIYFYTHSKILKVSWNYSK